MKINALTVTEVNNCIKRTLDNDIILSAVSVKGEISNLKYHSSGHIYFSLKDESSKIDCVMFRGRAYYLKFMLEEGMKVIAEGRVSMYPASGKVQIYCDSIEQEGRGELFAQFEKLKEELQREGYFDLKYKKPLPAFPRRIGVVTSETGAVIQDIKNVTRRRSSMTDIVLYPAQVQGKGAFKEIIEGINYFNEKNSVDLIIIGRGGGSIEELWNFNERELAMAVFYSNLPVISAVGHEVDYTICDFIADVRAATPSQAAEIAVPLESEIRGQIKILEEKMENVIHDKINHSNIEINNLSRILKLHNPERIISNLYLETDNLAEKMNYIVKSKLEKEKRNLIYYYQILSAHSPKKVILSSKEKAENLETRLNYALNLKISGEKEKTENLKRRLNACSPEKMIKYMQKETEALSEKMQMLMKSQVENEKRKIETLSGILSACNPVALKEKGFSIVKDKNGKIITSKNDVKSGEEIEIEFKDGNVKGSFVKTE